MKLVDVYSTDGALEDLFDLLSERTPEQAISHEKMPTWNEHVAYVNKRPVPYWYLIKSDDIGETTVGSIYLSRRREIGVWIFKRHHRTGCGSWAVKEIMRMHPGKFYANISPYNAPSIIFFTGLDFDLIQMTYRSDNGS